jgi:hypothetical protein
MRCRTKIDALRTSFEVVLRSTSAGRAGRRFAETMALLVQAQ